MTDQEFASERGNRARNPIYPFGDIPLGEYSGRLSVDLHSTETVLEEYGGEGWILLTPVAGHALAAHMRGCHGFIISSGELLRDGSLRPTLCGIRVFERDMGELRRRLIGLLGGKAKTHDEFAVEVAALGAAAESLVVPK